MHRLFDTVDSDQRIQVQKEGYYRVCAWVTAYQGSGNGQASLYINGTQYCIARMGCNAGSYYHCYYINEIIHCEKNDQIGIYISAGYGSKDYNVLSVEKVNCLL